MSLNPLVKFIMKLGASEYGAYMIKLSLSLKWLWKWLGWNEVRWTVGTGLVYRIYLQVQVWHVEVDVAM